MSQPLFAVLVEDQYVEVDIWLFFHEPQSLAAARNLAKRKAKGGAVEEQYGPMLSEADKAKGTIYRATYSIDGDQVRVVCVIPERPPQGSAS